MSLVLPLFLTVSKRHDADAAAAPITDVPALHARLADALLGDALLDRDDLGPAWDTCESSAEPPFAHTPYSGIAIGQVRRSFVRASDGARLEQQIAVMPRWTLRHLPEDFTEYPEDALEAALPATFIHNATGATATLAPKPRPRMPGIVRRGAVVMALRFVSRTGDDAPADLVSAAERKCAEIGDVLR